MQWWRTFAPLRLGVGGASRVRAQSLPRALSHRLLIHGPSTPPPRAARLASRSRSGQGGILTGCTSGRGALPSPGGVGRLLRTNLFRPLCHRPIPDASEMRPPPVTHPDSVGSDRVGPVRRLLPCTIWRIFSSRAAFGETAEPRITTVLTSIRTAYGASVVRSTCWSGSLNLKMTTAGPRVSADVTASRSCADDVRW